MVVCGHSPIKGQSKVQGSEDNVALLTTLWFAVCPARGVGDSSWMANPAAYN